MYGADTTLTTLLLLPENTVAPPLLPDTLLITLFTNAKPTVMKKMIILLLFTGVMAACNNENTDTDTPSAPVDTQSDTSGTYRSDTSRMDTMQQMDTMQNRR